MSRRPDHDCRPRSTSSRSHCSSTRNAASPSKSTTTVSPSARNCAILPCKAASSRSGAQMPGLRRLRRQQAVQLAQVHAESGRGAGAPEALAHVVVAPAQGDRIVASGMVGGEHHAAVIVIAAQIGKIYSDAGYQRLQFAAGVFQFIQRRMNFRIVREARARPRQHLVTIAIQALATPARHRATSFQAAAPEAARPRCPCSATR